MATSDAKRLGYGGSGVVDGQQVLITSGGFNNEFARSYLEPLSLPAEVVTRSRVKHADGTRGYSGDLSFDVTANALSVLTISKLLARRYSFDVGIHDGEVSQSMLGVYVSSLSLSGAPGGLITASLSFMGASAPKKSFGYYGGNVASNVISNPITPAANGITLIIAVGGSTVLTITNDTSVTYTATPTLSGVTHALGCAGPPTTTQYFAALAYLLNQLDNVSAQADGATNVTITADIKATSTYDIVVTGTAISGSNFVTTATAGNAATTVPNDFIRDQIPYGYWYSGNTDVKDWSFTFNQATTPVYINEDDDSPRYIKVGLIDCSLEVNTYEAVQTHKVINIATTSFTLTGDTSSEGFQFLGQTELGQYAHMFESSANMDAGSSGIIIT